MAFSDGLDCPHCGGRLEVTSGRMFPIAAGLAAGWLAWYLTSGSPSSLGWVLPELYAVLAFGVVSPLVLMFTAKLGLAPAPRVAAVAAAPAHGHH